MPEIYADWKSLEPIDVAPLPADYQAETKPETKPEPKPERKVIHTSTAWCYWRVVEDAGDDIKGTMQTTATCDDGTVWVINDVTSNWRKLPSIPQD